MNIVEKTTRTVEYDEIIQAMDIDYDSRLELAERVYNFIQREETLKGVLTHRFTALAANFDDTTDSCKKLFVNIVDLVIGAKTG